MNKIVNSEMIILARESRGYTQSSLAKKIGVSQAAISKIEKGLKNTSTELLIKLIKALNYPSSFFYINDHRYPPATPFHRKKQSLPIKLQCQIEGTSNIIRIQVLKLLEGIEIIDNKIIYLDVDDYDGSPAKVAQTFRRYLKLPRGPINNLINLLEDIGIIIVPCDFGTNLLDGFTLITKNNLPIIFINKDALGDRQRFTLAHELGHIIMHNVQHPEIEQEANLFASEFLMPREDIRSSFSKVDLVTLASLKPYWKVSMAALLTTASTLGKITPNQSRYLWCQMSKYGYRKREPPRLDIPKEEPSLLQEIIEIYFKELEYTVEDLCEVISTSMQDFISLYPRGFPQNNLRLVR